MTKKDLVENIKKGMPKNHTGKIFALMLFFTEIELGRSNVPNKWVNTANHILYNGAEALNAYANTQCPASQLVDARTPEELADKMEETINNFQDQQWLETELYPHL